MIYLPLLVFVCVTVRIAGWRKALEITAVSVFICLLFGLTFAADAREVPRNLWIGLRGILYLPVYAIRHPGEWLYYFVPSCILMLVWFAFVGLRKLWSLRQGHSSSTGAMLPDSPE